jgi:hypothetical protein
VSGVSLSVELTGPFFQRDPGLTLRGNIERMMQGIAEEGERSARDAFRSTEGARAPISYGQGRVADHVIGRVVSRTGKKWRASAVVSVNTLHGFSPRDAVAIMAAGAGRHVERIGPGRGGHGIASGAEQQTHIMRSLAKTLRSSRAVLIADLSKGIE